MRSESRSGREYEGTVIQIREDFRRRGRSPRHPDTHGSISFNIMKHLADEDGKFSFEAYREILLVADPLPTRELEEERNRVNASGKKRDDFRSMRHLRADIERRNVYVRR